MIVALGLLLSVQLSAQVVSKDSISTLNEQKHALKIGKDLNEQKIKLTKLENQLAVKTRLVDKTAEQAQISADKNGTAADRLTEDAQDKKKASRANNSARHAQHDAKKARKAYDDLENLNKDIESLKSKIADDEIKLAAIPGYPFSN